MREQASAALDACHPGNTDSVRNTLIFLRGLADRMETIQAQAIHGAGHARRSSRQAEDAHKDAYDAESARQRRTGVQADYISTRERDADVSLAVFDQRRAARQAWLLSDEVADAVKIIRSASDWLNEARHDLREQLRSVSWDSHLER